MTAASPPEHSAAVPLWRDVRVLRIAGQVVVLLVVGLVVAFLTRNLLTAMSDRGLVFGYTFLGRTAGFDIGESPIPYSSTDTYGKAYLVGLLNTLFVSFIGIILATVLGIIVGVARLSPNWLVNRIASTYVEIMRNTPLLVQLFLLYFAVFLRLPPVADAMTFPGSIYLSQRGIFVPAPETGPTLPAWLGFLGIGIVLAIVARMVGSRLRAAGRPSYRLGLVGLAIFLVFAVGGWLIADAPLTINVPEPGRFNFTGGMALSPEFAALLVGLVIYTAAFIGEVVRGGIQAVRRGQVEAARALGMSEGETLRLIVFPQALRIIVPPLTSQYLNLAKNSSLAIAIGYPDLFKVGQTMSNQTGQPVPVIVLIMSTYLSISLVTSLFMNIYNRRVQVMER